MDVDYIELIEDFKKTGQLPTIWQWTARELICAANVLDAKRQERERADVNIPPNEKLWNLRSPMMLLYGLALENLLKGVLVAQGVDATSTGELNNKLKTHNLVHLWKEAGLPSPDWSEDVLKNLHWSIEVGRYPVGTKPDPKAPPPVWVVLTNVDHIMELLQIAEDRLRELQRERAFERTDLARLYRS